MNCPYCNNTVNRSKEEHEYRGRWTVHTACQTRQERRGTYLIPGGDLVTPERIIRGNQLQDVLMELRMSQRQIARASGASDG